MVEGIQGNTPQNALIRAQQLAQVQKPAPKVTAAIIQAAIGNSPIKVDAKFTQITQTPKTGFSVNPPPKPLPRGSIVDQLV